jgi:hypothetical protein
MALAALTGGIMLAATGVAAADAGAGAVAVGSPGLLSGNVLQLPVNIPINACGNSLDGLALLNPSFGNTCANVSVHRSIQADPGARPTAPGNYGKRPDKGHDKAYGRNY